MIRQHAISLSTRLSGVRKDNVTPRSDLAGPHAPPPSPLQPAPAALGSVDDEGSQLRSLVVRLQEAALNGIEQRKALLDELRRAAIEIGVGIARRLLHNPLFHEPGGLDPLLRKALERLQPKHGADVHLHPTDLDVLRGRHAVGFSSLASDETLRFIPNPALRRGECKIQAGELLVWTDFDTQLDELQELLLEEAIAADPELLAPPPRAPGETDAS